MKKAILLLTLLISFNISAQKESKAQNLFLRVYSSEGEIIGKGHLYTINDSLLILSRNKRQKELSLKEIGKIKTKRSGWHNVIVGAASGAFVGVILGLINPPTESSGGTFTWAGGSSGEELVSGIIVGIIPGTIAGGVSGLFKNPRTYLIGADPEKWNVFVESVKYHGIKSK